MDREPLDPSTVLVAHLLEPAKADLSCKDGMRTFSNLSGATRGI